MTERELFKDLCNESYIDKQQVLQSVLSTRSVLNKQNGGRFTMKKTFAAAASIALIALSCFTVFAVSRYLTPEQTAEMLDRPFVANAFKSEDAKIVNQSAADGKYMFSFLGIANGKDFDIDNTQKDKTYAVVAISNADGSAMTNTNNEQFFVSPLINGLNPGLYNIATMHGAYTDKLIDGILYRLIECDNIEMFANRELYLCINDGPLYSSDAFVYDGASGKITVNESYNGINLLFNLPISQENADDNKVLEFINNLENSKDEPLSDNEEGTPDFFTNKEYILENGLVNMTLLKENFTLSEEDTKILTPKNNVITFSYDSEIFGSGNSDFTLPFNYKAGESFLISRGRSGDDKQTTGYCLIGTMLEDGNVEFSIYYHTEPVNK